jgi:uncharacterized protein
MKLASSRRNFLTAGIGIPAAAMTLRPENRETAAALNGAPSDKVELNYNILGKTKMKVTTVAFGCMVTSDPSVITKAADLGINYFDTARGYQNGNNERMVGEALKGRRKDLFLSSKNPIATKKEALANLETSLKELNTDYLDIWYLHAKSKASDVTDEWLEAQAQAKKEGKIRFAGVSTHNGHADLIPAILAHKDQIDVLLTSYNFTMGATLDPLLESVSKAGLGIVGMKVMAGGFRKPKPGDKTFEILKREGAMLSALKWVLRNPYINTTIPSITDMDQLDENLRAMKEKFQEKDDKILAAQLEYIRPLYCRMCGSCSGTCAQGLPVADLVRYLSYVEGYGQYSLGRESFRELPLELQAKRCGDCSICSVRCPNGVQVAQRVSRAQEIFA